MHLSLHSVQHWFYEREWLRALAARIEANYGSLVRGLCAEGHGGTFETQLAFAFLYNWSRPRRACYPFYEVRCRLHERRVEVAQLPSISSASPM